MLLLTILMGMTGVIERVVETSRVPCVNPAQCREPTKSWPHSRSVSAWCDRACAEKYAGRAGLVVTALLEKNQAQTF